jgi:uncharacterized membrane protein
MMMMMMIMMMMIMMMMIIIPITMITTHNRNREHEECKNKSDNSCNRENWNRMKINQKILNSLSGKHDIKHLQETALFGTAHITS